MRRVRLAARRELRKLRTAVTHGEALSRLRAAGRPPARARRARPIPYTAKDLAEKILTSKAARSFLNPRLTRTERLQ
jgi:hypothetical protein